ncbi:hypothetical protein CDD82_6956 [Ophiocordyceps australis]|uniref:Major facilitator superfamily (MFS) profile domain-containing protein n=1 Tax=Ophiocordyceps australis TaxID=1399860 RepID=A0A2C5YPP9_9HYPO|nr:hypothetical protein CDD82_6956 [Ophiocordyceps australis]
MLQMASNPPFLGVVVSILIADFSGSIGEAAWNAYLGGMSNSNHLLGFLHGFYGTGALLSHLVASFMITKGGLPWNHFYYFMASIEVLSSVSGFWWSTGVAYRASVNQHQDEHGTRNKVTMTKVLVTPPFSRVTWLCSFFLLGYVAIEVAIGGWILVFMTEVRKATQFAARMTATGFWLGITLGRFLLCFIYLLLVIALGIVSWLVPQFLVSAIAFGLQGFLLGPLFPAGIVVMSRLLPRHLHVSAIGFAAAFGSIGSAVLPFAVGAIAQVKGVPVLQPIVLAILVVILCLWLGLLRCDRK